MRNVVVGVLAATLSGAPALSQDKAEVERASVLHEFSDEMLECSVYYRVAVRCFENYPDPRAAKVESEYRAAADQLTTIALRIARSIGQSNAAFTSSATLMMREQMAAINQSCIKISVLQERYAAFCQHLAASPDDRFNELLAGKTCGGEYRCQKP
jgi:hypothetical protein